MSTSPDNLSALSRNQLRTTRAVGVLEAVSLLVLVVNLATVDLDPLAQALGPVHGLLYLAGIALVWSTPFPRRRRWLALVPGIGTWLAARPRRKGPTRQG